MPLLTVPKTVRAAATRAAVKHVAPAYAYAWSLKLAKGKISLVELERLNRFFLIQNALYEEDLELGEITDVVAAWNLCGGDSARAWARKALRDARKEGYSVEDATIDLLCLSPEEIYQRFQLGAWRYEYGMDARKAARFIEEYQLTRNGMLDLRRAFGDSAKSISTALFRRFHHVDELSCAKAALKLDEEYREAAQLDIAEITESLSVDVWKKPDLITARAVWPVMVAYAILSIEAPELLVDMNRGSMKPPKPEAGVKGYLLYHDVINIYSTYFHISGAKYKTPTAGFEGIENEVYDFVSRAYRKQPLQIVKVRKLLEKMRRWTAENKMAGGRFHIYNMDWKKGNWRHILDVLPLDSDLYAPFSTFVFSRKGKGSV